MGTVGHVGWGPARALTDAALATGLVQCATRIEDRLTRFRADSEVARLDEKWREVSADTAAVLAAAEDLRRATRGAFSALVGGRMRDRAPAGGRGASAGPRPVTGRIEVAIGPAGPIGDTGKTDPDAWRARVLGADPRAVDLGAIAKGYAADRLRDLAVRRGATDVLVTLGRSSMARAGAPARIALSSPWAGLEVFGTLVLEDAALSVSADPGTVIGPGRRPSHALDPTTGLPARTDLCGVVVCGAEGMACEAFSTAYLVLGLDAALELDRAHPELRPIFFTVDGRVLADPELTVTAEPGAQRWLTAARSAAGCS